MSDPTPRRTAGRWSLPALVALGLHAFGALLLARVGPITPAAGADRAQTPIEVVFAGADEEPPRRFTELPEDRADTPPERAELLSNVDSRARDEVAGGEDETPHLEGIAEAPAVAIPAGDPTGSDEPEPADDDVATPEPGGGSARRDRSGAGAPPPVEVPRPGTPSEPREAPAIRWGDVPQAALRSPGSSSPLDGTVSLSTTDWAYGDWLVDFRRDFVPKWRPPSGYRWMLIHGRTLVELHIAPNGEMRSLDIIGREGHHALHDASERALRKAAPFRPLPDDFPDDELVLRLELIYPKVWR